HEAQVPADTGGPRSVLVPEGGVLGDLRGVLQLQPRAGPVGADSHRDPARVAAELPGRGELARRLARPDRAAGVALDLVVAALHEIAGDRRGPAGQPVGTGQRVPEILGAGVVDLTDGLDDGLARVVGPGRQASADRV